MPSPYVITRIGSGLDFIRHVLSTTAATDITLIVCVHRRDFGWTMVSADNDAATTELATLETLAAAARVTVVFAPTLNHLRAYLAGIPRASATIAVWNAVAVHRGTAFWAAQGIGRTVAALVDAGRSVLLGEPGLRTPWWEEAVPALNATVDTKTLPRHLMGRTTTVGKVLARWFVFEEEETTEEEEAMEEATEQAEQAEQAEEDNDTVVG